MNKYINAEAVKLKVAVEVAEEQARKPTDAVYIAFLNGFKKLFDKNIDEMDSADVQEVKHGHWIVIEDEHKICATEFICSKCGETFTSSEMTDKEMLEMMKYCMNCGAKMDEENEE